MFVFEYILYHKYFNNKSTTYATDAKNANNITNILLLLQQCMSLKLNLQQAESVVVNDAAHEQFT